ncbi:uncharacterized protein B0T15DRAFT_488717 [Chaetomium strumarium]|uniref:Uncharacterized protein n=1 Tax=Chaetomium strumarium TaxID=1170767 RepID=A0AAJ0H1X7_9PEZI|nr:hypothetical protein B0T15DRAFT_488717 [Chaetomium strumarium]
MGAWFRNVGRAMAAAGKAIHDDLNGFGQNAGAALDGWGKDVGRKFDPNHPVRIGMAKAGEISFGAANGTLQALDHIGKNTEIAVNGAYENLHQQVSRVDWDKLSQAAKDWVENIAKTLALPVAVAAEKVFSVPQDILPKEIVQWIDDHPAQTAFLIVAGVVFFAPHLVTVPVLESLGFTADGVAAGSAAAALHSMIGQVQAGSIFSLMQSAGAGGAPAAVADVFVSTAAPVAIGTTLYFRQQPTIKHKL